MKKRIFLLFIAVMTLLLAACGSAAHDNSKKKDSDGKEMKLLEKGKLIVATDATFPPFEMPAEDGEGVAGTGYTGLDIEVAAAIAEQLDLELVVQDKDFDYVLYAPQNGKADLAIAGIRATPEREAFLRFSVPYVSTSQVVVVPEDTEMESLSDLVGREIGVVKETTSWVYCLDSYDNENITPYDTYGDAVNALKKGKVDALVLEHTPAKSVVRENEDLDIFGTLYAQDDYVIGVAKDNPGLQKQVNEILQEMDYDGTLRQIVAKYIPYNPLKSAE